MLGIFEGSQISGSGALYWNGAWFGFLVNKFAEQISLKKHSSPVSGLSAQHFLLFMPSGLMDIDHDFQKNYMGEFELCIFIMGAILLCDTTTYVRSALFLSPCHVEVNSG